MTKDEALKLALKFVEDSECGTADLEAHIKEALAQPEQEPIGYASEGAAERLTTVKQAHEQIRSFRLFTHDVPLYTAPQRPWVGLTYEEQRELYKKHEMDGWGHFYNAIEAKLKEKNVSTL